GYTLHLDDLCGWVWSGRDRVFAIELEKPPLVAGSVVVRYRDTAGTWQTLASDQYVVSAPNLPTGRRAVIAPAFQALWPATFSEPGAVEIDFQAGYGDVSAVPRGAKRAMLKLIAHWYRNTEAVALGTIATVVPKGYDSLVAKFISRSSQVLR